MFEITGTLIGFETAERAAIAEQMEGLRSCLTRDAAYAVRLVDSYTSFGNLQAVVLGRAPTEQDARQAIAHLKDCVKNGEFGLVIEIRTKQLDGFVHHEIILPRSHLS